MGSSGSTDEFHNGEDGADQHDDEAEQPAQRLVLRLGDLEPHARFGLGNVPLEFEPEAGSPIRRHRA